VREDGEMETWCTAFAVFEISDEEGRDQPMASDVTAEQGARNDTSRTRAGDAVATAAMGRLGIRVFIHNEGVATLGFTKGISSRHGRRSGRRKVCCGEGRRYPF
jgi:hypothetical protein